MSSPPVRIVHYVNQFFGGIGGEDKAGEPLSMREGPVGPGLGLQKLLADQAHIVTTIVAGDNFVHAHIEEARAAITEHLRALRPDVVVAGPAFNAGRYGMACVEVCRVAAEQDIPSVTAMYSENPALEMPRRGLYILPTGELASSMPHILPRLAAFALKLGRREELGSAIDEGYLPRGYRKDVVLEHPAVERALAMLKDRLAGRPFQTELLVEIFDRVAPAPPVADLAHTRVALITTGGIVPKGNPDRLREYQAVSWAKYAVADLPDLTGDRFEPIHGGYDSTWARQDPDRVVPLDALRALAAEGLVGEVHPYFYVTTGVGTAVASGQKFGREIADDLRSSGVGAAILTGT